MGTYTLSACLHINVNICVFICVLRIIIQIYIHRIYVGGDIYDDIYKLVQADVTVCSDTVTTGCYHTLSMDGFVVLSLVSTVVGVLWIVRMQPVILHLQARDRDDWIVMKKHSHV